MNFTLDINKLKDVFGEKIKIIDPEKEYAVLSNSSFSYLDFLPQFPKSDDSETVLQEVDKN
ncbi:MAG: hypothetical protein VB064_14975 [Oscillospiraceae bacterium]|nr:hypothetical protein [Oscillospiraceae bacterium]